MKVLCPCPSYSFWLVTSAWHNVIFHENNENDNPTIETNVQVPDCVYHFGCRTIVPFLGKLSYLQLRMLKRKLPDTVLLSHPFILPAIFIMFKVISRQINYGIIEWKISGDDIKARWTQWGWRWSWSCRLQTISIVDLRVIVDIMKFLRISYL